MRGRDLRAYSPEVALGIRLHRQVDAATDRHRVTQALRSHFADGDRRYAGIVLDLAADYALIADWAHFSQESLPAFTARCGLAIGNAKAAFETAARPGVEAAAFDALLQSFGQSSGVDRAVQRIAQRSRHPQRLIEAAKPWPQMAQAIRADLPELMDDLLHLMLKAVAELTQ